MKKLVVASGNKGKLREIQTLIGNKFNVVSMADEGFDVEVEENGSTFEENAIIKAKAVFELCHCPVISDDSGLMVDALGGAPGVYSARYAGEPCDNDKNNAKLLSALEGTNDRRARFVSVVAFYDGTRTITAEGTVEGAITLEKKGTNGFGYDPLFYSFELEKTFGEATNEEKNTVSHRARALASLVEKL